MLMQGVLRRRFETETGSDASHYAGASVGQRPPLRVAGGAAALVPMRDLSLFTAGVVSLITVERERAGYCAGEDG